MIFIYFEIMIALVLGIIFADAGYFYYVLGACIVVTALCLIAKLIIKNIGLFRLWLVAAFLLGFIISSHAQDYETRELFPVDSKFITLKGYVASVPEERDGRYKYIIKGEEYSYLDKNEKINEDVRLSTLTKLDYGESVTIRGFLDRIDGKNNSNDFDYNLYYKGRNIFYKISDYEITTNGRKELFGIKHIINTARIKMGEVIEHNFVGDEAAVLKAVVTGNKKEFSEDYYDLLLYTNTLRMLYPAYLHIFMIMGIMNFIFVFFRRKTRDIIIAAVLIIYAIFNFTNAVALKSTLLIIVTFISLHKLGYTHYTDLIAITVTLILISNPLLLYNCGFVVSVTLGIMIFVLKEPLKEALHFISYPRLRSFIVFYLIATVGSVVLFAYYFQGTSPWGPILNLIYFPLVIITIVVFWIFASPVLVFGVDLFMKPVLELLVYCIYSLPFFVEKLPFARIDLGGVGIVILILFYLCLALVRNVYIRGWRNFKSVVLVLIILGGSISVAIREVAIASGMNITFVNVGHGDGILIRLPKGERIIIDGGGGEEFSSYDTGKRVFIPYLKKEGVFDIDLAIVTHYHKDHCLGTIAALKNMNIDMVAMPDVMKDNKYRKEIERLAEETETEILYLAYKDKIRFDSGAVIEIISPENDRYIEENDTSVVFSLTYNGFKALFMGDATKYIEDKYFNEFEDVDLIKVGHHGSDTSTGKRFLDLVKPEIAVISINENSAYGLPNGDVISRLEESGADIFRTDMDGDITFTVYDRDNILINTFNMNNENIGKLK